MPVFCLPFLSFLYQQRRIWRAHCIQNSSECVSHAQRPCCETQPVAANFAWIWHSPLIRICLGWILDTELVAADLSRLWVW
jgi:hypothetical protein